MEQVVEPEFYLLLFVIISVFTFLVWLMENPMLLSISILVLGLALIFSLAVLFIAILGLLCSFFPGEQKERLAAESDQQFEPPMTFKEDSVR